MIGSSSGYRNNWKAPSMDLPQTEPSSSTARRFLQVYRNHCTANANALHNTYLACPPTSSTSRPGNTSIILNLRGASYHTPPRTNKPHLKGQGRTPLKHTNYGVCISLEGKKSLSSQGEFGFPFSS
jgi:hypothetical protein